MTKYYPQALFYMHIVIMRKTCWLPSSLNWPLHRFPSNLNKIFSMSNFTRLSIKRRKTNLPVEQRLHWVSQKTTEGAGRRIKRTSPIGENVHGWQTWFRKISGWIWPTLPKTAFFKVLAVLKTISFLCNIKWLFVFLSGTSLQYELVYMAGPINDKSWNRN